MTDPEDRIREFLDWLGEDPNRPGLLDTPQRTVAAWDFWTSGYDVDPSTILKTFEDGSEGYDEMVFQGALPLFSTCEHHLAIFFGIAHICYIPNQRVVGLSKLSRLLEVFARRLQVQERLTTQVADAIDKYLEPIGVGVVLRCRHMCMESRGIQKIGTITYTSALRGALKKNTDARAEFLKFVDLADAQTKI